METLNGGNSIRAREAANQQKPKEQIQPVVSSTTVKKKNGVEKFVKSLLAENIGNIGNIGSPKTRKYRWKYRDNIDIDKNYMETTEIVRKTWKFLLKLCRMFI